VNLDFDFLDLGKWENFYKFMKAIHELKYLGFSVRVYRTFKGYHVRATHPLETDRELPLRIYLGDDPFRIDYDVFRERNNAPVLLDTLYVEKLSVVHNRRTEYYQEEEIYAYD